MDGAAAWILMVSAMTVLVSCHKICFIGSEYNPQSGIPPRWFLPYTDPCECTAVRLGGMLIHGSPYRKGAPYYTDELFSSEDSNEIQKYFNCSRAKTVPTVVECLSPEPLGLEDGTITDDRITASSHQTGWPTSDGRLNDEKAWIPYAYDDNPWIEVDLVKSKVVSGIITQGSGVYDYYFMEQYKVAYKKQPSSNYIYVTDGHGNKVFIGNTDGNTPVTNLFDESVVSTIVRIEPIAWERGDALRMELLGCHLD